MTKYVHIVQVHPVENGEPNLAKVRCEWQSESKEEVDAYIAKYNSMKNMPGLSEETVAVYHGRVNDATGELE